MSRIKVGIKRRLENSEYFCPKRGIGSKNQGNDVKSNNNNNGEQDEEEGKIADGSSLVSSSIVSSSIVSSSLVSSSLGSSSLVSSSLVSSERTEISGPETWLPDERNIKICCQWKHIRAENLCVQLSQFYSQEEADSLLAVCEDELVYNVGEMATVKLFGKRVNIPRKQVAHGDPGLTYTFSGTTVPARPWTPLLIKIRDHISQATDLSFNFVLINRYNDGNDYIGEHKDDEKDLLPGHPIASLSFGQPRDFVFRHQDSRGRHAQRKIDSVKISLEHGMLLLMNHPTNSFWYHSLPRRAKALGVRINMTFRKMQPAQAIKT